MNHPNPPAKQPKSGCLFTLVIMPFVLGVLSLLVLCVGSLLAQFFGLREVVALGITAVVVSLLPALFWNALLTGLRVRLFRREAWFGETFLSSLFLVSTVLLLALVLLVPVELSRSLKKHGSWPFGKRVSALLEVKPSHPVLKAGRRFVRRLAYLLEDEQLSAVEPIDASAAKPTSPLRPQPGLRLPARGRLVPPKRGGKTRLRLGKNGNSLIVAARLGRQSIKARFLLDTGASFLTLSKVMARRLGVEPPFAGPTMTLQTANGRIRTKVGLLPRLKLGTIVLKNVAYVLCDSCADRNRGLVGLMGLNILNRFRYTIDRQELWIELTRNRGTAQQSSDLSPFVTFRQLRGETRFRVLRGRTFVLTGALYNRAPLSMKGVLLKVTYLRRGRAVKSRLFRLGSVRRNSKRVFRFRDRAAPRFRRYRVSFVSASWSP